jgi:hypothetical protein
MPLVEPRAFAVLRDAELHHRGEGLAAVAAPAAALARPLARRAPLRHARGVCRHMPDKVPARSREERQRATAATSVGFGAV